MFLLSSSYFDAGRIYTSPTILVPYFHSYPYLDPLPYNHIVIATKIVLKGKYVYLKSITLMSLSS